MPPEERIKTRKTVTTEGKTTPHLAIPSKTMITPAKEVSALRKRERFQKASPPPTKDTAPVATRTGS